MKICKYLSIITLCLVAHFKVAGQDYSSIKLKEWNVTKNDSISYDIGFFKDQKAFFLKRKIENSKSASIAYPKNLKFRNGDIDLDIALPIKSEGFIGVAFRIKDSHHYETVYFRPYSSGTIHAIQYMPELKPEFNWWDYEALKFQAIAVVPVALWFHVKLKVLNDTVKVYLNHSAKPSMIYQSLNRSLSTGSVGFWLGNSEIGAYKNLKVIPSRH